MEEFSINFLALAVCAFVRMIFGMIWYSRGLFGPSWMALVGCSEEQMKKSVPKAVPIDLIAGLVMAFVLVHAVHYARATTPPLGAAVGFFNWLGFIAVVNLAGVLWEKRPFKLFLINSSLQLLTLVVMGAILAAWP